ncbi:hypothetical protein C9374_010631 [Naegleria lovaniensis]|uniref:CP-type G domain-containing protein n=1 Tax=Naegleria lovaniensis TaxID=51637 RepID=A0AA88GBI0_NAELO|nr:uncharacterized protein C9374_010631 [Naegleria lovaniensis]KAG2374612.1 hypothetical protein C9374_010631 [Naegleria lovaniensis]
MPGTRTKNKMGGLGKTLLKSRNKKKEKVLSDRHQETLAASIQQDHDEKVGSDELPIEEEILKEDTVMHNMINRGRGKLESIIQTNDLQDLMLNAKMSLKRYEKESATFLIKDGDGAPKEYKVVEAQKNSDDEDEDDIVDEEAYAEGTLILKEKTQEEILDRVREMQELNVQLPIPRRPREAYELFKKNSDDEDEGEETKKKKKKKKSNNASKLQAKKQLIQIETDSFLRWRRSLAEIEESYDATLTPYEKNIEVWRQLWRVVERSDIVVQIVDCRNPLQFQCEDLEKYVKEVDPKKENFLLLNKADLLTKKQRFKWACYFKKKKINFLFFSAKNEITKIANRQITREELLKEQQEELDQYDVTNYVSPQESDWTYIFSRSELLFFFKSLMKNFNPEQKKSDTGRVVVGMVGYPNVGKSSLVNVLCGKKKVAVGSTPGKTKHFQTLPIGDSVMLADCPGLVFPSIQTTKEEMIVDGILSIDHQMRDYRPPMELVCGRIPRRTFELTYGLTFPKIPGKARMTFVTPENLLRTFCKAKGLMSQNGVPNYPMAARRILKDYVDGKILFCHAPPENVQVTDLEEGDQLVSNNMIHTDNDHEVIVINHDEELADDDEYFTESEDGDDQEDNRLDQGDEDVLYNSDGEIIENEDADDEDAQSDSASDDMEWEGEIDDFNLVNVHTEALERKKEKIIQYKGYDPFELDEQTIMVEQKPEGNSQTGPMKTQDLFDSLTEKQKRRKFTHLKKFM